jgi:hypothetical protein
VAHQPHGRAEEEPYDGRPLVHAVFIGRRLPALSRLALPTRFERGRYRADVASRSARVVPAAIAATGAGLALEAGGYFPRAWVWSGVVLLWIAALAGAFGMPLAIDRRAAIFLGGLALLTGWTLLSGAWSSEPQQTLLEVRRDVVYLGVTAAALFACSRLAARQIPAAVLAASVLIAIVGVGRYLSSGPADPFQGGLLSWPVGYANGFAAISAVAIPSALGWAAHGRTAGVRSAAAAAVAPLLTVLLVTSSFGGVLATAAGLFALVGLDPRRRVLIRTSLRLGPPVAVLIGVGVWADLPAVMDAGGDTDMRRAVLATTAIAAAALSAFLARRVTREPIGSPLPRTLAFALGVLATLLGVFVTALPEVGGERVLRLLVGTVRADYWRVAWNVADAHPALGSGAGTFGHAWLEQGPPVLGGALDAHGLYLETLAELGPIGLGLLLVALAMPLVSAPLAARTSRLGAAAAAGYVAFLVHAFVDWDWEVPAVTLPALGLGASVVILARRSSSSWPVGPRLRVACVATAVLLAVASLLGLRSDAVPAAAAPPWAGAPPPSGFNPLPEANGLRGVL